MGVTPANKFSVTYIARCIEYNRSKDIKKYQLLCNGTIELVDLTGVVESRIVSLSFDPLGVSVAEINKLDPEKNLYTSDLLTSNFDKSYKINILLDSYKSYKNTHPRNPYVDDIIFYKILKEYNRGDKYSYPKDGEIELVDLKGVHESEVSRFDPDKNLFTSTEFKSYTITNLNDHYTKPLIQDPNIQNKNFPASIEILRTLVDNEKTKLIKYGVKLKKSQTLKFEGTTNVFHKLLIESIKKNPFTYSIKTNVTNAGKFTHHYIKNKNIEISIYKKNDEPEIIQFFDPTILKIV